MIHNLKGELVKTFVDFDNIPRTHETMIHVPFSGTHDKPGATDLLERLYKEKLLDAMYVEIRPPHTTCSCEQNGVPKIPTKLCLVFRAASGIPKEWGKQLKDFWTALHHYGVDVVWKHDEGGFKIGPNFEIIDSWDLDDGMC